MYLVENKCFRTCTEVEISHKRHRQKLQEGKAGIRGKETIPVASQLSALCKTQVNKYPKGVFFLI